MTWTCETCSGCPSARPAEIHKDLEHRRYAVVLEWPLDLDVKKGCLLNGDQGTLVRALLEGSGIDLDDCHVTTALNCRPNEKKEAMLKKAMLSCRARLLHELKVVMPEKVLCLSTVGFSALSSVDKNLPITKKRGRWHHLYGMKVMPTLPPRMVLGSPDFYRDLEADVRKFASTEPEPTPDVTLWVPETVAEAKEAFAEIARHDYVALDVETTGFSPYRDDLLAIGMGVLQEDGTTGLTVVLDEELLSRKTVVKLLQEQVNGEQTSVWHNLKFDLKWVRKLFTQAGLAFDPRQQEDTMLLNYSVDERPMSKFQAHSLKNLARVRFDAPDYDISMGKWIVEYKDADAQRRREMIREMHTYLALDCYYTARLYEPLLEEAQQEGDVFSVYEGILVPGSMALAEIEARGVLCDREFYEKTDAELESRARPILERIREFTEDPDFNPGAWQQLYRFLYKDNSLPVLRTARRGKLQEGPTSKPVLKMLKKKHPEFAPFIDDVLEYRNLTKTAGTYVKGMLSRMDDDDRIRGDFLPHGTSTGRLSSVNPNLQNIPESSHTGIEVRSGFVAPEGWTLLEFDYSQLELRMAAHMSDDEKFCAVYQEGRDVHQEVAFAFFQKPADQVTKYERYMAKCVNFGVVYGRGAASIANGPEMEYVEEIGGSRWTKEEVQEFFDAFFDNFPDFKAWCEEQKRTAYEDHVCVSPLGRRRRFSFIPRKDNGAVGRQAVNTPIQGTASDFTFTALTRIHARLKELNEREGEVVAHVVSTVHDSILVECRLDWVDYVREVCLEEMEDHCPLESKVPFKADVDVAPRWGEMGKWEWDSDAQVLTKLGVEEEAAA